MLTSIGDACPLVGHGFHLQMHLSHAVVCFQRAGFQPANLTPPCKDTEEGFKSCRLSCPR